MLNVIYLISIILMKVDDNRYSTFFMDHLFMFFFCMKRRKFELNALFCISLIYPFLWIFVFSFQSLCNYNKYSLSRSFKNQVLQKSWRWYFRFKIILMIQLLKWWFCQSKFNRRFTCLSGLEESPPVVFRHKKIKTFRRKT